MGYFLQSGGRARFPYSAIATEIIPGTVKETVPSQNYIERGAAARVENICITICSLGGHVITRSCNWHLKFHSDDLADANELGTFVRSHALAGKDLAFLFLISKWLELHLKI